MAASAGLFRRAAALSGAEPADRRRPHELRLRARLCRARAAEGAGRRDAAPSRSAPTRAGSPAPTRSACPSRGSSSLDLPVGSGTPNRAQFDEWRRALAAAAGDARPFRGRRRQAARRDPASGERQRRRALRLPDHRQGRRLRGEAGLPPLRRHARCRASSARGRRRSNSPACSRSATGEGSSFARCPERCPTGGTPIGGLGAKAILWAVLGALAGGILLNLMPCVFPILALKALHLSRAGRRRARGAVGCARLHRGRDRRHRRARRSPARASARREPRRAGRSSCRTRARSCCCCCSPSAITANLLRSVRTAGPRRTRAAGGQLRHRRARRLRRDALRRAVPRRRARHRAAAAAGRIGAGVRGARAWARAAVPRRRLRSRASRTGCRSPGAWMDRLQRFLAIPMAASAIAGIVAALPARRDDRARCSAAGARSRCCGVALVGSARSSAASARGLAALPSASRVVVLSDLSCQRADRSRSATAPSQAPSRGARRASPATLAAGQARLRLFHRRLVPDLQGQ